MRRLLTALLPAFILVTSYAHAARHDVLVADLSEHFIKITTSFSGARVLLFGAVESDGEIVVVVRGPADDVMVRRKEKVAGLIWVNGRNVEFATVPGFYKVLSGRPLEEWLTPNFRRKHELGPDYLDIRPVSAKNAAEGEQFRRALIRNMRRARRFGEEANSVQIVSGKLFRADLILPANVPTGYYNVDVLLIENGKLRSVQSTPLLVKKTGMEEQVYTMAYEHPALYGIAAIIIAVLAGLLANAAFRKV